MCFIIFTLCFYLQETLGEKKKHSHLYNWYKCTEIIIKVFSNIYILSKRQFLKFFKTSLQNQGHVTHLCWDKFVFWYKDLLINDFAAQWTSAVWNLHKGQIYDSVWENYNTDYDITVIYVIILWTLNNINLISQFSSKQTNNKKKTYDNIMTP